MDIGIITQANETIEMKKLNRISPLFLNHFVKPKFKREMSIPINIPNAIIFEIPRTLEKSVSVAK
jgi:hypothetical protein